MSKRKRARTDQGHASHERHQKVRIQEVQNVAARKTDPSTSTSTAIKNEAKNDEEAAEKFALTLAKTERRALRRKQQKIVEKKGDLNWQTSTVVGGQLLDCDPVSSADEEYILIPYKSYVGVYSTSTSLLLRKIETHKHSPVVALALNPQDKDQLYTATKSGSIEKWNWRDGSYLGGWRISSDIFLSTTTSSGENDLLYTIDRKHGRQWLLTAHRLTQSDPKPITEVKTLFRYEQALSGLKVLESGRIIIVTSGPQLIVGVSEIPCPQKLNEVRYVWRIFRCPDWIVSFDARCTGQEQRRSSIDIVIGDMRGVVYVYENFLDFLSKAEKGVITAVHSRRLHWHRNAVFSVKWSMDGNYVISGGQETVLVIWQLETGQRQDLPHLGAPIESILVTPSGSSYAIRLADNSVMILSTAELKPFFSIAGIQATWQGNNRLLPFIPTVDAPSREANAPGHDRLPACLVSHDVDQLLLAVPSSQKISSLQEHHSASYLQTCDLVTGQQISRQALTRTNMTALNQGPEHNTIQEPNVTHLQTSCDNEWLATVDVWSPPLCDFESSSYSLSRVKEKQLSRLEIYLRFWSWNEVDKVWELVSRIDNPHPSDSAPSSSNRIINLASDPAKLGFSTIDESGCLRFWKPSKRRRNGLTMKDREGKGLVNWKCPHFTTVTPLEADLPVRNAELAYSSDGTLLAASTSLTNAEYPSIVYLIDTDTAGIASAHSGLAYGSILGLGLLDQYLIVLSQLRLMVKDLVTDSIALEIQLDIPTALTASRNDIILSTDHIHHTFAISTPSSQNTGKARKPCSTLAIFDSRTCAPISITTFPGVITSLLPSTSKKAWYVLDAHGEASTVQPPPSFTGSIAEEQSTARAKTIEGAKEISAERKRPGGISDIFGNSQSQSQGGNPLIYNPRVAGSDADEEDQQQQESKLPLLLLQNGNEQDAAAAAAAADESTMDTRVVSREQLAEVFEGTGSSMAVLPPIGDMFERVARLCIGRRNEERED